MSVPVQDLGLENSLRQEIIKNRLERIGDSGSVWVAIHTGIIESFESNRERQEQVRKMFLDRADRLQPMIQERYFAHLSSFYSSLLAPFNCAELHEIKKFSKLPPLEAALASLSKLDALLVNGAICPRYQPREQEVSNCALSELAHRQTVIGKFCRAERRGMESQRETMRLSLIQEIMLEIPQFLWQS
ncbi:MAG: hypothetical protein A3E80_02980 [Chlamydiae bacterium RIFCSPHIGHO2_12_FULL_49_9]|nr:MAG: hypothetical protein A3E80_02980 [Chlamydiae bacterium RIFCSPHIGHO2_12_FULL_49_9]